MMGWGGSEGYVVRWGEYCIHSFIVDSRRSKRSKCGCTVSIPQSTLPRYAHWAQVMSVPLSKKSQHHDAPEKKKTNKPHPQRKVSGHPAQQREAHLPSPDIRSGDDGHSPPISSCVSSYGANRCGDWWYGASRGGERGKVWGLNRGP